MGAPCWLVTSKNVAAVEDGFRVQNFQLLVLPIPISISEMLWSFLLPDTQGEMLPLILISLEHLMSSVALNAILNSPLVSLANTRW